MLDITLLGTGGMMPLTYRWLTACCLRCEGHSVLIDCGEATQIAMRKAGLSFKQVDVILITHFHADHVTGLPGFLLSMGNEGREEPVTIVGPAGVEKVVRCLCVVAGIIPFPLRFIELSGKEEHFAEAGMEISAYAVKHRVPCYGYRIDLKRAGRFDPEKAKANNVPMKVWSLLQKNGEADYEGRHYVASEVLGPPRKGLSFAYSTDTRPCDGTAKAAKDVDLFICEGMFGDAEKHKRALETSHMTMQEAARLARDAGVKALWLTHYSPSMPHPDEYIKEVRDIFPETECATDGKHIMLNFEEE